MHYSIYSNQQERGCPRINLSPLQQINHGRCIQIEEKYRSKDPTSHRIFPNSNPYLLFYLDINLKQATHVLIITSGWIILKQTHRCEKINSAVLFEPWFCLRKLPPIINGNGTHRTIIPPQMTLITIPTIYHHFFWYIILSIKNHFSIRRLHWKFRVQNQGQRNSYCGCFIIVP